MKFLEFQTNSIKKVKKRNPHNFYGLSHHAFWRHTLKNIFPKLKIRYNYPFLGKPDGHVAPLRKQFYITDNYF